MLVLLGIVSLIVSVVALGCWIYTVVVAFQNDGALSGILSLCPLIGFVLGWINVAKWNHMPVMAVWSGCIAFNILLQIVAAAMQQPM